MTAKIGFAKAVMERGDSWLHADHIQGGSVSAATRIAMGCGAHHPEWRESMRMRLCETTEEQRLFQLEAPLYRCGCDGLCERHPDCPGVNYDQTFPYKPQPNKGEC